MDLCPRCLIAFPRHLVIRARCHKRWRGHNFDLAAAEGALGAAVARVLGVSVRTNADLEAFYRKALVRSYGEGLDANPAATFDPAEGEAFEFHVGLREPVDDATAARVDAEARAALAASRRFTVAG